MRNIIVRSLLAFVAGFLVTFVLILGVELISNVLHPFPKDFQGTHDEVCTHVANYPNWILAGVVVAWGLIAAIGTWTAQRIGNLYSATALGMLLCAGVALNIAQLPYPGWFKIVIAIVVPLAALAGSRIAAAGRRSKNANLPRP